MNHFSLIQDQIPLNHDIQAAAFESVVYVYEGEPTENFSGPENTNGQEGNISLKVSKFFLEMIRLKIMHGLFALSRFTSIGYNHKFGEIKVTTYHISEFFTTPVKKSSKLVLNLTTLLFFSKTAV